MSSGSVDHLAQIKADEREAIEALRRGEDRVEISRPFTMQQLRLQGVWADEKGRLWRGEPNSFIKVFDPAWVGR